MKRVSAIILFSVYLISATECYQFIKIPMLIKHYVEHKEVNKNMSFIQYLALHYSGNTVYDEDYEDDQKLPFKSIDNFVVSVVPAIITQIDQDLTLKIYFFDNPAPVIYSSGFLHNAYLSAIWQPPKQVS